MAWTLTTSAAIIRKAGANANSVVTASSAILADFEGMAEAQLNSATRKDWVAGYASVGANFKEVLSDAVSDIVAMKVINYDMSGFTSRSEAQTMLDVLRDNVNKNIEILKDDKNKEVMI